MTPAIRTRTKAVKQLARSWRLARYYAAVLMTAAPLLWLYPAMREVAFAGPAQTYALPLFVSLVLVVLGVVALMPPIAWVYGWTRNEDGADGRVAEAFLLSVATASITVVARDTLAIALLGSAVLVAGAFRATRPQSDPTMLFLAMVIGWLGGSHLLAGSALLSVSASVVLLNAVKPHPAPEPHTVAQLPGQPAGNGASRPPAGRGSKSSSTGHVRTHHDTQSSWPRDALDLVLFGAERQKPRYTGLLSVFSNDVPAAKAAISQALDEMTKRWLFDSVIDHSGRPSEIQYRIRLRKSHTPEAFLNAIRSYGGDAVVSLTLDEIRDPSTAALGV